MIQFFQFLLAIKVLRVESLDLLTFQGPDDCVVVGEVVTERIRRVNFALLSF